MHTLIPSTASFRVILTGCILGALLHAPVAHAQIPLAQVKVPFAFMAGDTAMPAGDYTVKVAQGNVLMLSNNRTGRAMFLLSRSEQGTGPTQSGVTRFLRHGDAYFLNRITVAGSTHWYRCVPGKRERQIDRLAREAPSAIALASTPSF